MLDQYTDNAKEASDVKIERLLIAIEESLNITRRYQFFLWTQGALQGIVPHESMICVFGDVIKLRFKYDVFSRAPLDKWVVDALVDPLNGVIRQIVADWLVHQRNPLAFNVHGDGSDGLSVRLKELGCGTVLAHGAREISGDNGSFFIFMQATPVTPNSQAHLMNVLVAHLHMALYRMLPHELGVETLEYSVEGILSDRELEVLQWVRKGKKNVEIAQQLQISPLTVKNHVQKILRKLGVSNRAQAVSMSSAADFAKLEARPSLPAMTAGAGVDLDGYAL